MSMLLRLILLPGIIGFYSLELLNSGEREGSYKLRGWRRVLKPQKPDLLTYHLHVRFRNRMVFWVLGLRQKFLGQKSDSNMQFGYITRKLMHYSS